MGGRQSLVFTSFSLQFQSAGDVLAMAWPEVRGGGRPPRDCRSVEKEGGSGPSVHRSLHRISTIDSTGRHLDPGDVYAVYGDGHRGGGDGVPYYSTW